MSLALEKNFTGQIYFIGSFYGQKFYRSNLLVHTFQLFMVLTFSTFKLGSKLIISDL